MLTRFAVLGALAACSDSTDLGMEPPSGRLPTLAEISQFPDPGRRSVGLFTPVGPDATRIKRQILQIMEGPGGREWALASRECR